jgi:D-alanyl-D-alanine carboxypeptidase (penicillin-binding protein 5/6)
MKLLILIVTLLWSAIAVAVVPPQAPPPSMTAKAYLLYDYNSGQVLLSKNSDMRIDPASLSKLMTAYLAFDALKHNVLTMAQEVTVPARAEQNLNAGESRMLLKTGDTVSVEDLLYGLIVQSGNDAAITLALNIAGNQAGFVEMMNTQAAKLGMNHSHFTDATALSDPQHYSTAHDLTILAAAIIRDFPQYYPIFKEKEFIFNGVAQANRNRLLWLDQYADGLKTGQTETAGFCLIGSSLRDKRRLISVVLGADSDATRSNESQKLLNYGFQNFDLTRLYKKDHLVAKVRVWKGTESEVEVGFRKDMFLTYPKGQQSLITAKIETHHPVLAPISAGEPLGTLKLYLAGKPYAEFPLTALSSSAQANVFARGWDTIRLLIQEFSKKTP